MVVVVVVEEEKAVENEEVWCRWSIRRAGAI